MVKPIAGVTVLILGWAVVCRKQGARAESLSKWLAKLFNEVLNCLVTACARACACLSVGGCRL